MPPSPPHDQAAAHAALALSRRVAIVATVVLVVLGLAWELWLAPTGRGTLAVKVLPLLIPLPGLVRDRLYTYRWLSLVIWLYVIEGVVRAASDRGLGRPLGAAETVLCGIVFVACAAHVRQRLALARRGATSGTATGSVP